MIKTFQKLIFFQRNCPRSVTNDKRRKLTSFNFYKKTQDCIFTAITEPKISKGKRRKFQFLVNCSLSFVCFYNFAVWWNFLINLTFCVIIFYSKLFALNVSYSTLKYILKWSLVEKNVVISSGKKFWSISIWFRIESIRFDSFY